MPDITTNVSYLEEITIVITNMLVQILRLVWLVNQSNLPSVINLNLNLTGVTCPMITLLMGTNVVNLVEVTDELAQLIATRPCLRKCYTLLVVQVRRVPTCFGIMCLVAACFRCIGLKEENSCVDQRRRSEKCIKLANQET